MTRDSKPENLFTEYDESIFAEGSIDPMGLRIIWTSLGSKIFNNKLNTVSTDIKFYTLNLFHHYLLQKFALEEENCINLLIRKKPYFNRSDLFDGLIIFLENLLINATYNFRESSIIVPGINKLNNLKNNENKKSTVEKISVNKDNGILVRQYLLGIHGRHKGPFQQMGVFSENGEDIYSNIEVWKNVGEIFEASPWKEAALALLAMIKKILINPNLKVGTFIEHKVEEVLTDDIAEKYVSLLRKDIYFKDDVRIFWLKKLGLNLNTAGLLYQSYLRCDRNNINFQEIILNAQLSNDDFYLAAITSIEPFLTLIDKCVNRILSSSTSSIDIDLKTFINQWLEDNEVNVENINSFLHPKFVNQEAINRLKKLLDVYSNALNAEEPAEYFIIHLIKYHQEIMRFRGNLNWVSIGDDNRISVHKSIYVSDQYLEYLKSKGWVNTYYLPTVDSLHKGLTNEAA